MSIAIGNDYLGQVAKALGVERAKRIVLVLEVGEPVLAYVQQYQTQEQMDALVATPVPAGAAKVRMERAAVLPDGIVVAEPAACRRCDGSGMANTSGEGWVGFGPCEDCRR